MSAERADFVLGGYQRSPQTESMRPLKDRRLQNEIRRLHLGPLFGFGIVIEIGGDPVILGEAARDQRCIVHVRDRRDDVQSDFESTLAAQSFEIGHVALLHILRPEAVDQDNQNLTAGRGAAFLRDGERSRRGHQKVPAGNHRPPVFHIRMQLLSGVFLHLKHGPPDGNPPLILHLKHPQIPSG